MNAFLTALPLAKVMDVETNYQVAASALKVHYFGLVIYQE